MASDVETENETKALTLKQDTFCVHYTTIGAETYSNGVKSAIAASYSEKGAYVRASELLRNRKILDRISELHTENMQRNMITVDKVLADLEHVKQMALIDHQYAVAKDCSIAQGKHLAMFTERTLTENVNYDKEMDEKLKALASELDVKVLLNAVMDDVPKLPEPPPDAPGHSPEQKIGCDDKPADR